MLPVLMAGMFSFAQMISACVPFAGAGCAQQNQIHRIILSFPFLLEDIKDLKALKKH